MLYSCFLKKGVVYVPTVAKLQTGAYTDIEPVAVVPVSNTESLRRAFLDAIARRTLSCLTRRRTIGRRRSC
jgi:hypothetical protein